MTIVSPWRGKTFPADPISGQLFYLDVPNVSDPPPGWYIWTTTITSRTSAGVWTLVNRPASDHGDIVRPVHDRDRRH
jgi:hypothetical protein